MRFRPCHGLLDRLEGDAIGRWRLRRLVSKIGMLCMGFDLETEMFGPKIGLSYYLSYILIDLTKSLSSQMYMLTLLERVMESPKCFWNRCWTDGNVHAEQLRCNRDPVE